MKIWSILLSSTIHAGALFLYLGNSLPSRLIPIWIELGGAPGVKPTLRPSAKRDLPLEKSSEGEISPMEFAGDGNAVHSTVAQWTSWGNAPPEYPYLAQQKGWEGKVEVRITITPDEPSQVSLEHSSGHSVLDEAALDWARHARVNVTQRTQYLVPIVFRMASEH